MSRNGPIGGMLGRLKRLLVGGDEPRPELTSPTLFTATQLPTPGYHATPEERLFDAAPASTRTRGADRPGGPPAPPAGDEDQLFGAYAPPSPPPAPAPPPRPEPDDVTIGELADELSRYADENGDVDVDVDGPAVSVHGERLDVRPGPIRMTPSEALALAKEGPSALRRRRSG